MQRRVTPPTALLLASLMLLPAAAEQQPDSRDPDLAASRLDVHPELEVTLFAAEPLLLSPSNIDVDHRGRVWVCEVVNYRHFRNKNNPVREKGDRILILEDTDGDGRADTKKVFYQGRDIDSAHGVCVLGERVIVSALDKVLVFTDADGDDKPESKEVLFSGISGAQHDHGIHSFTFGPDGRLYFNFGNEGKQIKDKNGKPIVDRAGHTVADNRKPYQQGMVFRCDVPWASRRRQPAGVNPEADASGSPGEADASGSPGVLVAGFETLGWNFRNNWEVAVDSFGTLWQSDNDDDGNRGVRINYVMEFGNYGYRDELTGAGWRTERTGMAEDIPSRHWHQNDPGVVPNLLQTGAGSPTGILVYEGRLLPEIFHDQMIHCDAGPNVVRAYPVENDGAGYKADLVDILKGTRDQWFRPSDVCVAPDGSLIVADWYDPGVGGHKMGDVERGRLFRVTPKGHAEYEVPKLDFSTPGGAAEALKNPNLAARYLAWTALHEMQEKAEPALHKLYRDDNPRFRARALWLLGQIKGRGEEWVDSAVSDANADIRIAGLRLARLLRLDVFPIVQRLADDPSDQLRRECAIALAYNNRPGADASAHARLWAKLADRHEAGDRWSLEALGIGARRRWDACLEAWLETAGDGWNRPAGRDIVWRSRAERTPEFLEAIVSDPSLSPDEMPRYLRAFDFQSGPEKQRVLLRLAFRTTDDADRDAFVAAEALKRLERVDIAGRPELQDALQRVLNRYQQTTLYIRLIDKFDVADRYPELLALAQSKPDHQMGVEAVRTLLEKNQHDLLKRGLSSEEIEVAVGTARALGNSADGRVAALLLPVVRDDSKPLELRRQAVQAAAKTRNGARRVVKLARRNELDEALKGAAAAALHAAVWDDVKQAALKLFPLPPSKDEKPLPPVENLLKMTGSSENGRVLFNTRATCAQCHKVGGIGKEVGPDLSEIGDKLSRQALFDSILFPSAGISHNYETYTIITGDGNVVSGILTSQTPDSVTVKGADALERTFKRSQVVLMKKGTKSLMPDDIQKTVTAQELVDVVEYMTTLKKKPEVAGGR